MGHKVYQLFYTVYREDQVILCSLRSQFFEHYTKKIEEVCRKLDCNSCLHDYPALEGISLTAAKFCLLIS